MEKIAENYLIGMDLGTTNVKALLMDEDGHVLAKASRMNHMIFPGKSMVEQDADEWWKNASEVFREITSSVDPEVVRRIRGISISSQTVTMLPLDKNRRGYLADPCRKNLSVSCVTGRRQLGTGLHGRGIR